MAGLGTSKVTTIDWEGDGDLDLVAGNYDALLYRFNQVASTPPAPTISVNNLGGISIPAAGGVYRYSIQISNTTSSTVNFDVWTRMQYPNYTWGAPIIVRQNLSLPAGGSMSRNLAMQVPASFTSGYYYYLGYVGDYETYQIYSLDYGYFYKMTSDGVGGGNGIQYFSATGWDEGEEPAAAASVPSTVKLYAANPNPFNPSANLTFTISQPGNVFLAVYDLQGREVAVLEDGYLEEGTYGRTFFAEDLSSGVYFARLQAGNVVQTQKLLLVK